MSYAEQTSKYAPGTVIVVDRLSPDGFKANIGRFAIVGALIDQGDDDAQFLWRRIDSKGRVTRSSGTYNLRGGTFSWLETHARIDGKTAL